MHVNEARPLPLSLPGGQLAEQQQRNERKVKPDVVTRDTNCSFMYRFKRQTTTSTTTTITDYHWLLQQHQQ